MWPVKARPDNVRSYRISFKESTREEATGDTPRGSISFPLISN